jgi:hypothetical protein
MSLRSSLLLLFCGLALSCGVPLRGDQTDAKPGKLSKEAEAAAVEFAKTHHSELASLLEQLRTNAPKDYQAALLDLDRTRERIERNRKNQPERYRLELDEWKLSSRIRLLGARLAMGGDTALEDELRAVLRERHELRVKLLEDDRDRAQKRMQRFEEQIAEQRRRADDILDREFAALRKQNQPPTKETAAVRKGEKEPIKKEPVKKEAVTAKPQAKPNPNKTNPNKPTPSKKPAKTDQSK